MSWRLSIGTAADSLVPCPLAVRFYGTEGRPADSFTPPSPDPYEYIVFKGAPQGIAPLVSY